MNRRLAALMGGMTWIAVLVACTDGYPSGDVPPLEPAKLTQPQRVAALNTIAKDTRGDVKRRYRLDDCTLVAEQKEGWGSWSAARVPLRALTVTMRRGASTETFNVLVGTSASGETALIYVATKRIDAMHVDGLLRAMIMDCTRPAVAASQPR